MHIAPRVDGVAPLLGVSSTGIYDYRPASYGKPACVAWASTDGVPRGLLSGQETTGGSSMEVQRRAGTSLRKVTPATDGAWDPYLKRNPEEELMR